MSTTSLPFYNPTVVAGMLERGVITQAQADDMLAVKAERALPVGVVRTVNCVGCRTRQEVDLAEAAPGTGAFVCSECGEDQFVAVRLRKGEQWADA